MLSKGETTHNHPLTVLLRNMHKKTCTKREVFSDIVHYGILVGTSVRLLDLEFNWTCFPYDSCRRLSLLTQNVNRVCMCFPVVIVVIEDV